MALAVRARHARRVHHPRLRRPAPARRAAPGRVRRRLLRVAGRGDGRGDLGALAGRGVGPVRRRRLDADARAATSPTSPRIRAASTPWTRATAPSAGGSVSKGVGDVTARRRAALLRGAAPGAARRRTGRARRLAPGPDRGGRPDRARGRRPLPGLLGQPRRPVRRRPRHAASCSRSSTPATASAPPATLDPSRRRLYVLSNGGALYALDLSYDRVGAAGSDPLTMRERSGEPRSGWKLDAARLDAADQLFDPAGAAGVAGLPLDAEAVLAAGAAFPGRRAPTAASPPPRRAARPSAPRRRLVGSGSCSVRTNAPPRPMSRRTPALSCSAPGTCHSTGISTGSRWCRRATISAESPRATASR